jgi:hypothetical protein
MQVVQHFHADLLIKGSSFEPVSKPFPLTAGFEVRMIIGGGVAGVKRLAVKWVKRRRLSDGKKWAGILW